MIMYLYNFCQDNVPNSVTVIHVLADKAAQSLVLKSPVFDPDSGISVSDFNSIILMSYIAQK